MTCRCWPPSCDTFANCFLKSSASKKPLALYPICFARPNRPSTAVNIQVLNPDIDRDTITAKQIILDIRAVDASGRQFNIEIQLQGRIAYIQRAIFYLSRLHSAQLSPGQGYDQIQPTLGIHLLDFVIDTDTSAWHHCFEWRERQRPQWRLSDQQALWLIELPKARTLAANVVDRSALRWWAQFFNAPETLMNTDTPVPAPVRRAVEKLQELSADERTRQLAEDREKALIDWTIERNALLAKGKAEGKVEGIAEGEAKGRAEGEAKGKAEGKAEGIAEGEAKGKAEAKQDFARALLKEGFSVDKTAALTGLSIHDVQGLAAEL